MKNAFFTILFLVCLNDLRCQVLKFDSLYQDSCLEIKSGHKKTFVICYNRFHLLTRMGYLVSGKREKHWEIYDDGNLLLSGAYKHDKKNGQWEEYYVSGKELFRGKYKYDLSEGKWKVYLGEADLRGEKNNVPRYLSEIRMYKKGKLMSKKTYSPKGRLLKTEKW